MKELRPELVINGTFGECWVDDEYMAEVLGVTAEAISYEDINRPRKLGTGKKMMGIEQTGSLKFHKVTFKIYKKSLVIIWKAGKQTSSTIITKLDDPDALGAERILLKNVVFEGLTLANWEAKTKGEQEISFFFDDWEPLDLIEEE